MLQLNAAQFSNLAGKQRGGADPLVRAGTSRPALPSKNQVSAIAKRPTRGSAADLGADLAIAFYADTRRWELCGIMLQLVQASAARPWTSAIRSGRDRFRSASEQASRYSRGSFFGFVPEGTSRRSRIPPIQRRESLFWGGRPGECFLAVSPTFYPFAA